MGTLINTDLATELLKAIEHYIQRQRLVAQAMQDLDIDIESVGRWGPSVWVQQGRQDLPPVPDKPDDYTQALQRSRERKPAPQSGQWPGAEEWHYFLHGIGCRLTHTVTGEEIDWNFPDPARFDPYFFLRHLEWRLKTEPPGSLPAIREWMARHEGTSHLLVQQVMEEMRQAGQINQDWTLPW